MANLTEAPASYLNPVHPRPCPDPYILKHLNEYWCYCTGIWHDGRCFGILHSWDLVHWQELGGAMERLNEEATCYWAPEVVYENGRFLMYYSVGNETFMQIRIAIAEHPAGPFIDADRSLSTEPFAIDPHVFRDEDGKNYLFYATDFLEHTHIGTGTVCDEMLDEFTLAGHPRPVTRARFDWQVYDPNRLEKGGVRWHTIEGPFVLKHKA
ncbi:MAG: family 43 glycosylhydrolase [Acidobacteriota bacterium]